MVEAFGRETGLRELCKKLLGARLYRRARQLRPQELYGHDVGEVALVRVIERPQAPFCRDPSEQGGASVVDILEQGFEVDDAVRPLQRVEAVFRTRVLDRGGVTLAAPLVEDKHLLAGPVDAEPTKVGLGQEVVLLGFCRHRDASGGRMRRGKAANKIDVLRSFW